jgi:ESCRT-I complex subunit VPS37
MFLQRFDPQFLLLRLRHATTAQDDASEALASSFVQSSPSPSSGNDASDVDEFVREFRELRKVYHKRLMWGDRWASGQVAWEDG